MVVTIEMNHKENTKISFYAIEATHFCKFKAFKNSKNNHADSYKLKMLYYLNTLIEIGRFKEQGMDAEIDLHRSER